LGNDGLEYSGVIFITNLYITMDNFDLKKYLANNPLLEKSKDGRYEKFELNLSDFTPMSQKLLKSVMESSNGIQKEENEGIELEEGLAKKACKLAVKVVGDIAATFPKFFAEVSAHYGNDFPKHFVYSLLNDDPDFVMRFAVGIHDRSVKDDGNVIWGVAKSIGRGSFNLFISMVAIAMQAVKIALNLGCEAAGIVDLPEALFKAMLNKEGKDRSGMSGRDYENKFRR
jgi:hypothetical protein